MSNSLNSLRPFDLFQHEPNTFRDIIVGKDTGRLDAKLKQGKQLCRADHTRKCQITFRYRHRRNDTQHFIWTPRVVKKCPFEITQIVQVNNYIVAC